MSDTDDGLETGLAESPQASELLSSLQAPASRLRNLGELGSEAIIETLRSSLLEAMVPAAWRPNTLSASFVPQNRLQEILDESSVAALLQSLGVISDRAVAQIKSLKKILAILIVCRRPQRIVDYLEEGIDEGIVDSHLPFHRQSRDLIHTAPEGNERTWRQIWSFSNWDREWRRKFLQCQWHFLAPWLDLRSGDVLNLHPLALDPIIPLPFIKVFGKPGIVQDRNGQIEGMEQIEIHPAHYSSHNFQKGLFLIQTLEDDNVLLTDKAPHLLRPLLSFQRGLDHCFIFSSANVNLFEVWKRQSPLTRLLGPSSHHHWTRWIAAQFSGLAGAMEFYRRTRDQHMFPAETSASASTSQYRKLRLIDISAQNIFWSVEGLPEFPTNDSPAGTLKIGFKAPWAPQTAFLNLSRQQHVNESLVSKVEPSLWSFGCVLLEFLLWFYRGPKAIDNFFRRRREEVFENETAEESSRFYKSYGVNSPPTLKNHVLKEIVSLRQDDETSAFSHDVLDLIENGLLKVRPEERMSHEEVHQRLEQFEERASSDLLYCLPSSKTVQDDSGLDVHQAQGLELLVQPLFDHEQLRPLYQLFKSRVEDGSLRSHLSDFFEVYGTELQQEAVNAKQTAASTFVRKSARQIALEITSRLDFADASNKPWSSPPSGTRRKEYKVADDLLSRETTPAGPSTAVLGRVEGPQPPDSTLVSWSDGNFPGDDEDENKGMNPRLDLHSTPHFDLEEVRSFLVSPEAFSRLKAQLEHWVISPEGVEADKRRATEAVTQRYRRGDRKSDRKKDRKNDERSDRGNEMKVDTEVDMDVVTEEEKEEPEASEIEEPWERTLKQHVEDRKKALEGHSHHHSDTRSIRSTVSDWQQFSFSDESTSQLRDMRHEKNRVGDTASPETRPQTISTLSSLCQRGLVLIGLMEPPLEEGYQRVRWKSKRGKMLYDDYIEREFGALERLRQYLNGIGDQSTSGGAQSDLSPSVTMAQASPQGSVSHRSSRSPNDGSRAAADQLRQRNNARSDDRPAQDDIELRMSSGPLHLFSCIERGRYKVDLQQKLVTDISHDRELFRALRTQYHENRGRVRSYWSLRAVHSIHFMKFTYGGPRHIDPRCHDDLCDRSKSCDCIPPKNIVNPEGIEYQCSPVPAKQSPPVGPRLMMDYFTDPDSIDPDLTFVLNQLPKRASGELKTHPDDLIEAWGVYFKQGWDLRKIFCILGLGFFPPSLLFGVLWAVLRNDIQGGFGVAAWWVTMAAVFLGIVGTYDWVA